MIYYASQTQQTQEKPFTVAKKKLTLTDVESISVRDLAFKIKEVDDYIKNSKTEEARTKRKPNLAFFSARAPPKIRELS